MPPEPTRPVPFQFLRRSQRSDTSPLREQKQSKHGANNLSIFNSLQTHYSISPLDSYSYKLGGGIFPNFSFHSACLRVLCVSALSSSPLPISLFPSRLSASSSPPDGPGTQSLVHCFSHGGSHLTVQSQSFPSPSPIKKRK